MISYTYARKQKCFHQLETMDTDQCIQKLVRTDQESSERTQCKIEETVQYWVAQEKRRQ